MPHAPQLLLSLVRSRHTPEQLVRPVRHETVHTPAEQTVPDGHTFLHAPQLLTSVASSRQTPMQLVVPAPQET